jgi:hypothetical protein
MLATKPRNHKHHVKARKGVDDAVDDRETPPDVWEPLNNEFHFTLDVAAARHNAKCRRYYALGPSPVFDPKQLPLFAEVPIGDPDAIGIDGLKQPWAPSEVVWCNPPFSNLEAWVKKASTSPCTVVMLLPANRCEQPFWQIYIEPWRDERSLNVMIETRFLAGRRNFRNRGAAITNKTSRNPPFGIVIVIWDRRDL